MDVRQYYFPNIMRKINLAMLGLFAGIQIEKFDASGNVTDSRQVPVRFAHRQKFIPLLTDNQEGNKTFFYQNLPIMGLMIKTMSYAPSKVRGGYDAPIYKWFDSQTSANKTMFSGTPYTISYQLAIMSLHMKEMSMILEQVLPWFNPYRNITIQEWDFLPELTRDCKVTLKGTAPAFMDEVTENEIKRVEFTLDLDVDCMFYKPIPISTLIKELHLDLYQWNTGESTITSGSSGFADWEAI